MPQRVLGGRKGFGETLYRSVKTLFLKYFHKSKIHIDIVVQAGNMVIVPLDLVLWPLDWDVVVDQGAVNELGRSAIGASDGQPSLP